MQQKTKFIVIRQADILAINMINNSKRDNSYVVLDEYNGYSTICQYSSKYDDFHIVTVSSDKLDKSCEIVKM